MSDIPEFEVTPGRVKAGDLITVRGNVGTVSQIWIRDSGLTAFAANGGGAAAIVTAAVEPGGWQVSVSDPDGAKKVVGRVIVDATN